MTEKALKKLNEKQINYCNSLSVLIARDRENGLKDQCEKDSAKLRGYLECMEHMEIISGSEMKALYLWFFSENRKTI